MVRMTRGRAWIGVLGVLLVGIVALNVVTLSLAASRRPHRPEHPGPRRGELDRCAAATRSARRRRAIRHDAAALGLSAAAVDQVGSVQASPRDVAIAAQRLAAAGTAY